jgi:transcriptional regulator with XRE-family HTH domain
MSPQELKDVVSKELKTLGEAIHSDRHQKKLDPAEMERAAGVPQETLLKIESGESVPTEDVARVLAVLRRHLRI